MVDGRYLWDFPKHLLLAHCSSLNKPMNAYVNWVNLIFIIQYCVTSRKSRRMMYESCAECTLHYAVHSVSTYDLQHAFVWSPFQCAQMTKRPQKQRNQRNQNLFNLRININRKATERNEGYCCEHGTQLVRHISG